MAALRFEAVHPGSDLRDDRPHIGDGEPSPPGPCRRGFSSYSLVRMAGLQILFPLPDRSRFARRVERRLRDQGIRGPIEFDCGAFALRLLDGVSEHTLSLENVYADCGRCLPWRRSPLVRGFLATALAT